MKTEIAPLLIVIKLEQFDYAGAAAVGLAMLIVSFVVAAGDQHRPAVRCQREARPMSDVRRRPADDRPALAA